MPIQNNNDSPIIQVTIVEDTSPKTIAVNVMPGLVAHALTADLASTASFALNAAGQSNPIISASGVYITGSWTGSAAFGLTEGSIFYLANTSRSLTDIVITQENGGFSYYSPNTIFTETVYVDSAGADYSYSALDILGLVTDNTTFNALNIQVLVPISASVSSSSGPRIGEILLTSKVANIPYWSGSIANITGDVTGISVGDSNAITQGTDVGVIIGYGTDIELAHITASQIYGINNNITLTSVHSDGTIYGYYSMFQTTGYPAGTSGSLTNRYGIYLDYLVNNPSAMPILGNNYAIWIVGNQQSFLANITASAAQIVGPLIVSGTSFHSGSIHVSGTIGITARSGSFIPLIIHSEPTQSANLTEWRNYTGSVINAISSSGLLIGTSSYAITSSYATMASTASVVSPALYVLKSGDTMTGQLLISSSSLRVSSGDITGSNLLLNSAIPTIQFGANTQTAAYSSGDLQLSGFIGVRVPILRSISDSNGLSFQQSTGVVYAVMSGSQIGLLTSAPFNPGSNRGVDISGSVNIRNGLILTGSLAQSGSLNIAGDITASTFLTTANQIVFTSGQTTLTNTNGSLVVGAGFSGFRPPPIRVISDTTGFVVQQSNGSTVITFQSGAVMAIGQSTVNQGISRGLDVSGSVNVQGNLYLSGSTLASGTFVIIPPSASLTPLTITGFTTQSADLTQWRNISSSLLASVDNAGNIFTSGSATVAAGVAGTGQINFGTAASNIQGGSGNISFNGWNSVKSNVWRPNSDTTGFNIQTAGGIQMVLISGSQMLIGLGSAINLGNAAGLDVSGSLNVRTSITTTGSIAMNGTGSISIFQNSASVPLKITQTLANATASTANLTEWYNSSGSLIAYVSTSTNAQAGLPGGIIAVTGSLGASGTNNGTGFMINNFMVMKMTAATTLEVGSGIGSSVAIMPGNGGNCTIGPQTTQVAWNGTALSLRSTTVPALTIINGAQNGNSYGWMMDATSSLMLGYKGNFSVSQTAPTAQLNLLISGGIQLSGSVVIVPGANPVTSSTVPLIIFGQATQSANLTEWRTGVSGSLSASISASGDIVMNNTGSCLVMLGVDGLRYKLFILAGGAISASHF